MQICTETDDVLLTSAAGQCIRFPVADVRVFQGRTSMGVRGIALENGDRVISLSILRHCRCNRRRSAPPTSSVPARSGAAATGEEVEPRSP